MALRASDSSSSSASESNFNFTLGDDELVEVVMRQSVKLVMRFKCVSKHWESLISSPLFMSEYFRRHLHILNPRQLQHKYTQENHSVGEFVFKYNRTNPVLFYMPKEMVASDDFHSRWSEITKSSTIFPVDFKFLDTPPLLDDFVWILGNSLGLILYSNSKNLIDGAIYCICNPITKDRIQLPAPSRCVDSNIGLLGFLCESKYDDSNNDCFMFRFWFIRIPEFYGRKDEFTVQIFFSDSFKWRELTVRCPRGFVFPFDGQKIGIEHNGKLYFVGADEILVYDPSMHANSDTDHDVECCYTLDYAYDEYNDSLEDIPGVIGTSCGSLLLSHLMLNYVRIWELKEEDCKRPAWCLMYQLFNEQISRYINIGHFVKVAAFHPYNKEIVFFFHADGLTNRRLVRCNLRTMTMEVVEGRIDMQAEFDELTRVVLPSC